MLGPRATGGPGARRAHGGRRRRRGGETTAGREACRRATGDLTAAARAPMVARGGGPGEDRGGVTS